MVTGGKTRNDHMFSELPQIADIVGATIASAASGGTELSPAAAKRDLVASDYRLLSPCISYGRASHLPHRASDAAGKQPFRARLQLLAQLMLNAGKHTYNQPAPLAHLDHGSMSADPAFPRFVRRLRPEIGTFALSQWSLR